jgi:5-methylcytosine-specific restriction endonuclease McrA
MRHCTICKTDLPPNIKGWKCSPCARVSAKAYRKVAAEKMAAGQYSVGHCSICECELPKQYKCHRCRSCNKAYMKRYRETNAGQIQSRMKQHYRRNGARIRARIKAYRYRNRDVVRSRNVADYHENKEQRRAKIAEWQRRNPRRYAAIRRHACLNRVARKRGAEGHYTRHDVNSLMEKQHGLCAWCSKGIRDEYDVDHMMPLKRGGSNWPANLQLLCPPCNRRKGALTMDEFAAREQKYNPSFREAA